MQLLDPPPLPSVNDPLAPPLGALYQISRCNATTDSAERVTAASRASFCLSFARTHESVKVLISIFDMRPALMSDKRVECAVFMFLMQLVNNYGPRL